MKKVRPLLILLLLAGLGYGAYYYTSRPPSSLTLTGIVTTNDVIVSPQIAGQVQQLLVGEGDVVKRDQLLAVLSPDELRQESAFYQHSAEGATSQVRESALFSGIPITDRLPVEQRCCGVWVVDTRNGDTVAFLRFEAGVQEVFAVQVLPGLRYPEVLTDDHAAVANAFLLPDEALADVPGARQG